tara:strand:+ start:417 stop:911 length:495 start_codon:yes stop_codon:yes gene_type:complete
MMGVGKSTIGKKLAKKLKLKFFDIDNLIEKKEKNSISHIFSEKGESYFRKIEKQITLDILKKRNSVIALGGGAFLNLSIRKEIKYTAVSFWIDLDVKSISSRLKNIKKRPLLEKNNLEETINRIYSDRKKIYNESNFRIKSKKMNVNNTINKIIELYEATDNKV